MTVDVQDEALIAFLRDNGRASVTEIAHHMGMSRTTVQTRMRRLEDTGVITGYGVKLSSDYAENQVRAMIMIKSPPRKSAGVIVALKKLPELRSLYSTSGEQDLLAVIAAGTISRLDEVIDAIGLLEGVDRTRTSIILSTKLER